MEQSIVTENDILGGLFQLIISDLKGGTSTWEDFIYKATKFHTQLKATISASTAFLDSFQKIADLATTTRGGTKEIGTALTRLCLRHRSVEAKLKSFSSSILDCLIIPLQDRIEEWKKTTLQLDKERTKEMKRLQHEFKRHDSSFRSKKQSKLNKTKYDLFDSKSIYGTIGQIQKSSSLSRSSESEIECNERLLLFEELEKKALRRVLIEERSHFCLFVKFLRPVIEEECSMIQEIFHIQEIMSSLLELTNDPFDLPPSSENVLSNLKLNKNKNVHTPPSSPSSLGSRKSSISSSSSDYGQNKCFSLTNITASNYSSIYDLQPESNLNEELHNIKNETNHFENKNDKIKITSTNPFLNSYNHFNDNLYNNSDITSSSISYNSFSEDSVTPTNSDLNKNAKVQIDTKNKPAPPVRRTSSISNPNAITIGTLRNAAINGNYDLCKNLTFYDEINVLTKSMNDINFTLKNTDFTKPSSKVDSVKLKSEKINENFSSQNNNQSDYKIVKKIFENLKQPSPNAKSIDDESSPLPAPPPEAFLESSQPQTNLINHHHYNKITNVHREFLETLNSKLSQSPQNNAVRISKRKNSIKEPDTSNYYAKQKSRSASASRISSRKNSVELGNNNSLINSLHENFVDKLSQTLINKQQHHNAELARAVVLQRKQSVPDLNEFDNTKNRVVEIQTNSTQQPIYASRSQLLQDLYGTFVSSTPPNDRSIHKNGFLKKVTVKNR